VKEGGGMCYEILETLKLLETLEANRGIIKRRRLIQ